MESSLDWLVTRMKEPSTWVSLGGLVTAVGWNISPDYWQAIAGIGMGLGSLIGIILRERAKTTPAEIKKVVEATVSPEALK